MQLYSYFRSSTSYRLRIALNLKGLPYDIVPVHLVRGEQADPAYLALNNAGLVPTLVEDGNVLTQSLAIIEYLEEVHPTPALLPTAPLERAFVRSMALSISCDIHPLNNVRVLRYLQQELHVDEDAKSSWYRHWCESGLKVLEALLLKDGRSGRFCFGDTLTIADCCLVPQIFNAKRFNCDVSTIPTLMQIYQNCLEIEAVIDASPHNQPDAEV